MYSKLLELFDKLFTIIAYDENQLKFNRIEVVAHDYEDAKKAMSPKSNEPKL